MSDRNVEELTEKAQAIMALVDELQKKLKMLVLVLV